MAAAVQPRADTACDVGQALHEHGRFVDFEAGSRTMIARVGWIVQGPHRIGPQTVTPMTSPIVVQPCQEQRYPCQKQEPDEIRRPEQQYRSERIPR